MMLDIGKLYTLSESSGRSRLATWLAIFLIVAAYCCCSTEADDSETDNFFAYMRKRLGHFSRAGPTSPYGTIFEEYFTYVIKKNDIAMKNIDINDWRNVRPSGDTCIEFLIGFQARDYILSKPYDIVPLDSCLDWLFDESHEKKLDMDHFGVAQKNEEKSLKQYTEFKELYESTDFKDITRFPKELTDEIYQYIMKLLKINSDNPKNGCHGLWLQAYIDFIENVYLGDCDDEKDCKFYNYENGRKDSYLRLIADSSREAAKTCYGVMQVQMKGLIKQEYESSLSFAKKIQTKTNRVSRQADSDKWSREMIGVLQLAAGADQEQPINLADVVRALDRIKNGAPDTTERFNKALSVYALQNVDLKDSTNDPTGRKRYGRAMRKLCRPYIDQKTFFPQAGSPSSSSAAALDDAEDSRKPFEFYKLIYSMVNITNHEPTFGITKDKLEDDVIKNHWEALYLATFTCQIISTTSGWLNYETNTGSFEVRPRPNSEILFQDWPIKVMTMKLPIIYEGGGEESSSGKSNAARQANIDNADDDNYSSSSSSTSIFGNKFKGIFHHKSDKKDKQRSLRPNKLHSRSSNEPEPLSEERYLQQLQQQQLLTPSGSRREQELVVRPPVTPPTTTTPAPTPPPVKVPTPDTIKKWREVKGYDPDLPANIREIYPDLYFSPDGKYQKIPLPTRAPAPTPTPTTQKPVNRWAAISGL